MKRADQTGVEDDFYYIEPMMVGTAISDWGPLVEPRRKPWQRKPKKQPKRTFGFARALENE